MTSAAPPRFIYSPFFYPPLSLFLLVPPRFVCKCVERISVSCINSRSSTQSLVPVIVRSRTLAVSVIKGGEKKKQQQ